MKTYIEILRTRHALPDEVITSSCRQKSAAMLCPSRYFLTAFLLTYSLYFFIFSFYRSQRFFSLEKLNYLGYTQGIF